ncbi:MAG: methyltransferase [Planctomycetota bacterium]|jgi:hypothetical protein
MNPVEQLSQFATGHWISQMVFAFAKHGMGDAFHGEPTLASTIAERSGTQPDATYRLLRGLAPLGVVQQDSENGDLFTLTDMGALLTRDHPMSMVDQVLLEAGYEHVAMWTHLADNLVTGEMAPTKVFGESNYFGLFDSRPGHLETFSRAMGNYTAGETALIMGMESLDLSGVRTMVDVGGAFGALLSAVLERHPDMNGILYDLPDVVKHVEPRERMEVESGDFFASVPAADGYLLKHILHDWDDEQCLTILGNVTSAMEPGARIFIGEFGPVPGPNEPHLSKLFDLHMMLCLSGKERTLEEWGDLLDRAGLRIEKVHTSPGPLSMIEATR